MLELRGERVDLAEPRPRATMVDLIREQAGDADIHPSMDVAAARAVLDGLGLTYKDEWGAGRLTHEVYDELVEPKLVRPTFVLDHPAGSPLARGRCDHPTLVERFEVVVNGNELANAYSELNDPIDQRGRLRPKPWCVGLPATPKRARSTRTTCAPSSSDSHPRGVWVWIDRLTMSWGLPPSVR